MSIALGILGFFIGELAFPALPTSIIAVHWHERPA